VTSGEARRSTDRRAACILASVAAAAPLRDSPLASVSPALERALEAE
jgi:hypothetical protein